jgi:hypothetical protein
MMVDWLQQIMADQRIRVSSIRSILREQENDDRSAGKEEGAATSESRIEMQRSKDIRKDGTKGTSLGETKGI